MSQENVEPVAACTEAWPPHKLVEPSSRPGYSARGNSTTECRPRPSVGGHAEALSFGTGVTCLPGDGHDPRSERILAPTTRAWLVVVRYRRGGVAGMVRGAAVGRVQEPRGVIVLQVSTRI